MNYGALESEIVGVLTAYFAANGKAAVFTARVMPENQTELLQAYDKAMCNVQYYDSVYRDPVSTSNIVQEEQVKVAVFLQINSMKDADAGGYLLITSVKSALIGYKPVDARTRMWVSDYRSWQLDDGSLNPYLEFSFFTENTQAFDDTDGYKIDKDDTVETGGALVEIDSALYELPDTENAIGEDDQPLHS